MSYAAFQLALAVLAGLLLVLALWWWHDGEGVADPEVLEARSRARVLDELADIEMHRPYHIVNYEKREEA